MTIIRKVFVYDPNHVNPYGVELASTISTATGWGVVLYCSSDRAALAPQGVEIVPVLAGRASPKLRKILRRLLSPVRLSIRAGKSDLVLVWTSDFWDACVFAVRAALGFRTFFIQHNPRSIRPRRGLGGVAERLLLRVARVCVHSLELAARVDGAVLPVAVVPHPAYEITVGAVGARRVDAFLSARPRVALLGSLRDDKGLSSLPAIASASGGGWDCIVIGPDRIPGVMAEALRALDVTVVHPFDAEPADPQVIRELASCSVMLAPYTAVTESGSVILAHTVGVPVLALESPAFEQSLSPASRVDTPQRLGAALRDFFTDPWLTYVQSPDERQQAAVAGWRRILVGN